MSVAALEPSIRKILSAPGTDLNTISAKRVRKQLLELEADISEDWVKGNKDQIDALIASVYEAVSSTVAQTDVSSDAGAPKRKHEDLDDTYDGGNDDEDEDAGGPSSPPRKPKKSKSKRELTDEEFARQLSSQINGSSRSSRSAANGKSKPKKAASKSGKRSKKSAERVTESDDDNSELNSDGEKKPKKRKSGGGGGAKGGFQKEFVLRCVRYYRISLHSATLTTKAVNH
jgi:upstream activation factor subunit UAF30